MKVVPIASTSLHVGPHKQTGYTGSAEFPLPADADELVEIAGRVCYQSWDRPNPKTATNQGYLENIIEQGHFSVLEHSSVSFYVEGVSRSLLTELERHRFLSFSVISQRYVDADQMRFIMPPALRDVGIAEVRKDPASEGLTDEQIIAAGEQGFEQIYLPDVRSSYRSLVEEFEEIGLTRKQAREAARSVLPNATEVKMVVTGNLRCWRDVLGKRYHEAADAEIREFAGEVLTHLKRLAPNSFQDFPEDPFK